MLFNLEAYSVMHMGKRNSVNVTDLNIEEAST